MKKVKMIIEVIKFIGLLAHFVKNGADCYSKIGHAVTVLRWQS